MDIPKRGGASGDSRFGPFTRELKQLRTNSGRPPAAATRKMGGDRHDSAAESGAGCDVDNNGERHHHRQG